MFLHCYHFMSARINPKNTHEKVDINVFMEKFTKLIKNMLHLAIIQPSSSHWIALAVTIDYRELNKEAVQDPYPLLLLDEVQSYLAGGKLSMQQC